MGDFIKTLTSLIGSIKAKTDGKIDILQKRIDDIPIETVLYTPQTLTEEQQKQARDNIGATDAGSMFVVITKSIQNGETIYSADKTYDEIMEAVENRIVPVCNNPVYDSAYGPNNIRCIFRNSFYTAGMEYASFQSDGDEYFYEVLIFGSGNVTVTSKPKIMTGATTDNNGTSGMVPLPYSGDNTKFLRGDGRWADVESDVSLGVSGAAIGQIAKITAVDAQGVPTAWSPVDMPSGGGAREWALLSSGETQEVVKTISVDVDLQKINELLVFVRTHGSADSVDSHVYWGVGTSHTAFGISGSLHRSQWRLHALKLLKIKGERWFGTVEYGFIQKDQIDAGNVELIQVAGFKVLAGAENKIAFGAYYYGDTELVAGTAYQVWGR